MSLSNCVLVVILKIVRCFILMSKSSSFELLSHIFSDGIRIFSCFSVLSGIEGCSV